MSFLDLMGLLSLVQNVARRLKEGQELPIRWTVRRGRTRYLLAGTLRREKAEP